MARFGPTASGTRQLGPEGLISDGTNLRCIVSQDFISTNSQLSMEVEDGLGAINTFTQYSMSEVTSFALNLITGAYVANSLQRVRWDTGSSDRRIEGSSARQNDFDGISSEFLTVGGITNGSGTNFAANWNESTEIVFNPGAFNGGMVARYNDDQPYGEVQHVMMLAYTTSVGNEIIRISSGKILSDGSLIIIGEIDRPTLGSGNLTITDSAAGTTVFSINDNDAVMVKFNSSGIYQWHKVITQGGDRIFVQSDIKESGADFSVLIKNVSASITFGTGESEEQTFNNANTGAWEAYLVFFEQATGDFTGEVVRTEANNGTSSGSSIVKYHVIEQGEILMAIPYIETMILDRGLPTEESFSIGSGNHGMVRTIYDFTDKILTDVVELDNPALVQALVAASWRTQ